MEQKEIKINCPDGYTIDKENSTFECIKFKPIKKELPKTWEEYCKNTRRKVLAEAMLALYQLIQLRDCYNDGWNPDWTETSVETKYTISICKNVPTTDSAWIVSRILAFKTQELRDQFLENFRDLIEIAKPLL